MNLTYEQEKIITTNNKTMLVSASAGSGKTFVVVEKIINSIVKDKMDIDSMLIVTFTNAAASELKERIVAKLQEALDKAYKEKDKEAIYHISRQINKAWSANISTIHSFCLSVIKENFYTLGIDPNVTTMDATKANIMLMESISEVIEQEFEKANPIFYDILEILGKEEELVSFTVKFYEFYSHIIDKNKFKEKVLNVYNLGDVDLSNVELGQKIIYDVKAKLDLCRLEIVNLIDKLDGLDDFTKHRQILEMLNREIERILQEKAYDGIYNIISNPIELPNMPRYNGEDIETKDNVLNIKKKVTEEIKQLSKIMYKDSFGIIQELNSMKSCVEWLFEYIELVKHNYSEKKRKKGVVDFTDYEELALVALKDEQVVKRYKDKFDVIYVDEYQDTSYVQEEIISRIAKQDNCIMVGDVKQSIYGFRNAAPQLFSGKYETFSDDLENEAIQKIRIVLAENFRSRKEVLYSVNDIFEKIMTLEFGGARYTNKETLKYGGLYDEKKITEEINPYKTEINLIEYDKTSQEELNELDIQANVEVEAIHVADKIKELVGNLDVYDAKKKTYRKCEYKDIVILLQKVAGVADRIVDVLKQNGVPAYANNKTSFYETDEIKLIMSFLKILDNELDDISLASIMYSKIGMFTLDDLVEIRSYQKDGYLFDALCLYEDQCKNEKLYNKIRGFLELINSFKDYVRTYSLSEVIVMLYNKTHIYESILLEDDGKQKQLNMDALIQVAKNFEDSKNTTIYSFVKYIESIRKREGAGGESPSLVGENENVVRLMTIHHSKGLEFPVVILMNMTQSFDFPETKDKILLDNNLGLGINILDKNLNVTYPSIINMAIKSGIKYTGKSEKMRLLYVALTRAKEKLVIFGTVKNADKYISDAAVQVQGGNIPKTFLQQNNSQLKNIMAAVLATENNNNFIVNIVKHELAESNEKQEEEEKKGIKDKLDSKVGTIDKEECDKKLKKLKQNLEYVYPKSESLNILQKYTATKLNKKNEDTNNENASVLTELTPKILSKNVTNKSFGSLVHKIIENVDLNNANMEDVLECADNVLKEFDAENINKEYIASKIYNMINTLKQDILKIESIVEKEYEFVILDNLEMLQHAKLIEPSYIQGVIDLYIENNDKSVIIDFKTDKVTSEQDLINEYNSQLAVYKRGIELSLNKENVEVYIYSFSLEKLIKVY